VRRDDVALRGKCTCCLGGMRFTLGTMARLLLLRVTPPSREAFDALDALVGQSMESAGGPPAGLMSHVVYQEEDALVVADVWRTEDEGLIYIDEVLRPLIAEAGLTAHEMSVHKVWSFARP
jgi:hypothetical protein